MPKQDKRPVSLVLVIKAPNLKAAAYYLQIVENEISAQSRKLSMGADGTLETFGDFETGDGYRLRVRMLEG